MSKATAAATTPSAATAFGTPSRHLASVPATGPSSVAGEPRHEATELPEGVEVQRAPDPGAKRACPVSRGLFLDQAQPLALCLGGQGLMAMPKQFATGSFGWYVTGKLQVEVAGQPVLVQVGGSLVVVGSGKGKGMAWAKFERDAKALGLGLTPAGGSEGQQQVGAVPRDFRTGSFGWYATGKVVMVVGGEALSVQVGVSLTVIGSKAAE